MGGEVPPQDGGRRRLPGPLFEFPATSEYSRYRLVRYRIRRKIGYKAVLSVCMCVCVSVENRLEREIAYSADFFQSQVPRTKRYPVYFEVDIFST